jgi:hypothetical protein
MPPDGSHHLIECHPTKVFSIVVFASFGFHSWEARRPLFLQNIANQCYHCDNWLHWWIGLRLFMEFAQHATWWFSPFTECHWTKVFSIVVFASTGFHSWEARSTLFLQNIENKCCQCDYWLYWWIGLQLFVEFAQDASWWFSPIHRMSPNKDVFNCSVCQHWISLMGGKKDLVSTKYWQTMLSLW